MKDSTERIMYVGKAKNLRRRLASYFQQRHQPRRIKNLVKRIASIEVILVNNETESLILENNLIKHHRPRTNRALMRDIQWKYHRLCKELPENIEWKTFKIHVLYINFNNSYLQNGRWKGL